MEHTKLFGISAKFKPTIGKLQAINQNLIKNYFPLLYYHRDTGTFIYVPQITLLTDVAV
jgi:hypothetical protein